MSKFKGKWLALFSQTGSEICEISERIGRYPNGVITDNIDKKPLIDNRIYKNIDRFIATDYRSKSLAERKATYDYYLEQYDIITLHGWLNIIPAKVCEDYNIYNGHPGLITYYPELKGRDPQERAWSRLGDYMFIGSVIHKVTAEVDCGEVLVEDKVFASTVTTLDDTYVALKQTSLNSWVDFFKYKHYNKSC